MKTSILLPLAGILIAALAGCGGADSPAEAPRLVVTHVVGQGESHSEDNYSGEVRPRHETALAFRVGGKLRERLVELGQAVRAGQVLARLDPADVELNASSARASLAAARSELDFASAERQRFQGLRDQKFVSQAALEAKENAYRAAQGRFEAASAQAGLAKNQSAYASLVADTDGVVSAVLAEAGQVVGAGQAVLRIARPGEMEIAINVPENRVAQVKAAAPARIALWAEGGREYAGRVREISPMADAATRTYAVRVSLLEPDAGVRLGMTANVFLGRSRSGSVLVPATAIFQEGGKPAVWVVRGDRSLSLHPLESAQFGEEGVLVTGLQDGDRIVAAGVHKVVAGEKVRFAP